MAGFEKGNKLAGSRKGIPNKNTARAREAIAMFVNNNADRLEGWLDKVADENPAEAFKLFQGIIEYHIPKLARTEHAAKDGEPLSIINVVYHDKESDNNTASKA